MYDRAKERALSGIKETLSILAADWEQDAVLSRGKEDEEFTLAVAKAINSELKRIEGRLWAHRRKMRYPT